MRLILGAGCAGLSLARGLVEAGVRESIVLLDRRTSYTADRTWCFWQTQPPAPWSGAISHRWHRWQLVGSRGSVVQHTSAAHPYAQVLAMDFYEESLAALEQSPNVRLQLGVRVGAVAPRRDGRITVQTSSGELVADQVYDALGGAGPWNADRPDGAIELRQTFLGLEIEVPLPAFDPEVATLMDFRLGDGGDRLGGLHFAYVLPTSATRALVEHTTLGPRTMPAARRRAELSAYLEEHWGVTNYRIVREERGALPMTTHVFPASRGPRIHAVGAAAGAVRPSSGYAFVRLQRHAQAVAQAAATGRQPPIRVGLQRHATLDQLFLRALAVDPPGFQSTLLALARGTSGDAFARFMSDDSTGRDEAAVMRAVAKPGFLWAMAASSLMRPLR